MPATSGGSREHWEDVYRRVREHEVSWFQRDPLVSLRLVADVAGSLVDVGAGESVLADRLLQAGRADLTLLDLSAHALDLVRTRLGPDASRVRFVATDVVGWEPGRTFDCWHDRAVFHFLTAPAEQAAYVQTAARLVATGGALVMGTFASDGPTRCSGLPTARFEPADLAGLFSAAFTLEHAEHETHRTPRQVEQRFTWVVLRRG